MKERRLGLIVNPIAGIGGRVGLKGSDGVEIQKRALALGAVPQSLNRAIQALERIEPADDLEVVTYPGEMGEDAARACGFHPLVIGSVKPGETTADGKFTLLEVECLGSCGTAPMMQVDDQYHESLTQGRVDEILASLD